MASRRWDDEIPVQADWRDEAVFQALVRSLMHDDPEAATHESLTFRAPNGTLVDLWEAYNRRRIYDPAQVLCPAMLLRGGAEPTSTRTDALALFDAMTGAEDRHYVEIANGAHFVSAVRRTPAVFAAANAFFLE